ncbi:MAG: squalene synthase HpnC [Ignavibacteriae bacterium]|nr:squalene synthase HpnC [Ignavibacteriota bacterium]
MARRHYENFPVASLLLPKSLRPCVYSIYAFAREADDLADEGVLYPDERLRALDEWELLLDDCYTGRATHPVFVALAETVARHGIPKKPLSDLLTAFRMDVMQKRFETFADLLYYCVHSANPVGRLVLYIFHSATDRTMTLSDNICTGLQLANFWQDIAIDWAKGRLYVPLEDLDRFGYTENDLAQRTVDDRFCNLLQFEVDRTREFFHAGKPLLGESIPSLQLELRLTWLGGMTILRKIQESGYNVFDKRPIISKTDKLAILMKALLRKTA